MSLLKHVCKIKCSPFEHCGAWARDSTPSNAER